MVSSLANPLDSLPFTPRAWQARLPRRSTQRSLDPGRAHLRCAVDAWGRRQASPVGSQLLLLSSLVLRRLVSLPLDQSWTAWLKTDHLSQCTCMSLYSSRPRSLIFTGSTGGRSGSADGSRTSSSGRSRSRSVGLCTTSTSSAQEGGERMATGEQTGSGRVSRNIFVSLVYRCLTQTSCL